MQQMGQMFQPGGTSYFMPTMPQAQRFYSPQMAQIRATPRWPAQQTAQVRAGAQPAAAFPMQAAPYRSAPRPQQPGPRNMAARPMQAAAQAAAAAAAVAQQQPMPNMMQAPQQVAPAALANAARASNYKYTQNMRNPPAVSGGGPAAAAAVAPVAQPAVHIQGQEPLTPSMLASALPQEQKQMLGERLFPLIRDIYP